ncbi:hypothetical protein F5Y18DRAFT_424439 [Xylariaceae sp. FL1019]|nr:hypothetical protein F5Y18DRAFT_424439 [Xylariaceae sp. FL1019]
MSSSDDQVSLAVNIITFIGVPLAVLGVLPILYNTLATLTALSKIKRMLKHGKLTALTRSDIINKVIEVELPRYAVQPWDRFNHRDDYWQLSRAPSLIPGGSWTTFNWKTNTIGIKTQRVEYADQLRQPQVEVAFDELVAYLLDLGAVPDPHGWRLLRSTGLWTPNGCCLMKSPDNSRHALTIAPLDDSDGHLSLKITWEPSWTTRDASHLPPYWVRLPPPPTKSPAKEDTAEASHASEASQETTVTDTNKVTSTTAQGSDKPPAEDEAADKKDSTPKQSLDSIQKEADKNAVSPITCQFTMEGLVSALSQGQGPIISSLNVHSLFVEHLRVNSNKMNGSWFASAATAYGTTSQTMLWNYKIPDEILNFARKDTVPCGVLEMLFIVDSHQTPEWETTFNAGQEHHDTFVRRNQEQRIAMMAEGRMSPADRSNAIAVRMQREMQERMNDMHDQMRRDRERRELRKREALQSPRWDTKRVAEHCLALLQKREVMPADLNMKEIVGMILHRMVLDAEFASSICEMLDLWKSWADDGGLRSSDLDTLDMRREVFCQATLLVASIKNATGANEGTLSMDLQECLRMWRVVRLG